MKKTIEYNRVVTKHKAKDGKEFFLVNEPITNNMATDSVKIKIEADTKAAIKSIKRLQRAEHPFNRRQLLYIILIPLLIIEWAVVLIANISEIIANSVKDITLALNKYINAPEKPNQPKPGS